MDGIQLVARARKRHALEGILTHPDDDQLAVIRGVKRVNDAGQLLARAVDGTWSPEDGYDEFDDAGEYVGPVFETFDVDAVDDYASGKLLTSARKLMAGDASADDLAEAGALIAAEIDRIS